MSTRTTWHFVSRQGSGKMVPVIFAEASFRWVARFLSDSLNQLKSHKVLYVPCLPQGPSPHDLLCLALSFSHFSNISRPSKTHLPPLHTKVALLFHLSPLAHSALKFWEMQWLELGRGCSFSPKLKASTAVSFGFTGFTWYSLRGSLRQIKWEGSQYSRARHAFWEWV